MFTKQPLSPQKVEDKDKIRYEYLERRKKITTQLKRNKSNASQSVDQLIHSFQKRGSQSTIKNDDLNLFSSPYHRKSKKSQEFSQDLTETSSKLVPPSKLTSQEFINLIKNQNPYMKYQYMSKMPHESNYNKEYYAKKSTNITDILKIPIFTYSNPQKSLFLETSSRAEYTHSEIPSPSTKKIISQKISTHELGQVSYNSEYAMSFQQLIMSPSVSMKPVQTVMKLPALEAYKSNYQLCFDKIANNIPMQQAQAAQNRNDSTIKNLIQSKVNPTYETAYKKTFKHIKAYAVDSTVMNQGVFLSPSYSGQYKSVNKQDFKEHTIEPKQQKEDLMRLVNMVQRK